MSLEDTFKDLPVLVTGHTGFKGSWLSTWLHELGAHVIGYALDPPTIPNNFHLSHLEEKIMDIRGDIRDYSRLKTTIDQYAPRVIFHLAAQPLVLESYKQPQETIDTNVGGTVNVLEAVRTTGKTRAVICITSDKCYEDRAWPFSYRENDRLGGHDPYSASKAMAELAIASYRHSFFPPERYHDHKLALASARVGNVIGGGDFAKFRIVPDSMRACLNNEPLLIRNPQSIRPWQHVLVPLSGYLWLADNLLHSGSEFAQAWNFGPIDHQLVSTETLVKTIINQWGSGSYTIQSPPPLQHETHSLTLNCEKAAYYLHWRPAFTWTDAVEKTIDWFKDYHAPSSQKPNENINMYATCVRHIKEYTAKARALNIPWAQ